MSERLDLPEDPKILVVALRRLGDVLLTTPLIRSLRRARPRAEIDMLVFSDTAAILEGNPDLSRVIEVAASASFADQIALLRRLWQRYDLAITTQAGDRPSFLAIAAGRTRCGMVEDRLIGRIKRAFLNRAVPMGRETHRVEEILSLARAIGIEPAAEVVCPRAVPRPDLFPGKPYAVIHAAPQFTYKQWHAQGWRALAQHLAGRGLAVVATGGPGERERLYLDTVWDGADVLRLDGRLRWGELTALLRGAKAYAGPDTSVTHLASASGCPTLALYGPTDPRLWGPWPAAGLSAPWNTAEAVQRRGNVWLVQNPLPCMPCQHEGCLRRLDSYSRCLDEMLPDQVVAVMDEALAAA
ncbi:MAG: glycosyltransferase family 9 protein [Pseudorhodoplanes sp.]|nr:glycosyltransferase family 9 protein [Pseudorhodoplanes sp.]